MTTSVLAEYDLGPLTLIPAGEGRAYEVAGRQIAVFRLRSGAVRAARGRSAVLRRAEDGVGSAMVGS